MTTSPRLLPLVLMPAFAMQTAAQTNPAFVGEKTLRVACTYAMQKFSTASAGTNEADLFAYCNLPSPSAQPGAWAKIRIPKPDYVLSVAQGKPYVGANALPPAGLVGNAVLPSEGAIVLGFTEFIVDRAKQEATTYIVNRFAQELCTHEITFDTKNPSPQTKTNVAEFLPSTCRLLSSGTAQSLMGNGVALPSFAVVQTSLRRDVDTLPDLMIGRFTTFAELRYTGLMNDPDVRPPAQRVIALIGAARLAASYPRKMDLPTAFRSAAEAMSDAAVKMCVAKEDPPVPCTLPMKDMPLLRALLAGSSFIGSIDPADVQSLATPGPARDAAWLWIGKAALVNAMPPMRQRITAAESAIASYVTDVLKIDITNPANVTGSRIEAFMQAHGTVIDSATSLATQVTNRIRDAKGDRTKTQQALVDALPGCEQLVFSLFEDDFAGQAPAIQKLAGDIEQLTVRVARYKDMQLRGAYSEIIADALTLARAVDDAQAANGLERFSLPAAAGRALQFAADASETRDADGFAATLERYAAPADAYLRKRTHSPDGGGGYWTLNAYLGVRYGTETAIGDNIPPGRGGSARYNGLTIPAGLELGWAWNCCGSIGLFTQLIDVGQVASWRSRQSDTAVVKTTPPSFTLGTIFSPGLNVVWNVPKLPVTIGGGRSMVPQFRDLTTTTDVTRPKATVTRWTAFLALDVPILP